MSGVLRKDASVAQLCDLFREHPVWVEAGRHIAEGASSKVFFSHLPGEAWHLIRLPGKSALRPGPAATPDFAFRFTPLAIDRLAAVQGVSGTSPSRSFPSSWRRRNRSTSAFGSSLPFPSSYGERICGCCSPGAQRWPRMARCTESTMWETCGASLRRSARGRRRPGRSHDFAQPALQPFSRSDRLRRSHSPMLGLRWVPQPVKADAGTVDACEAARSDTECSAPARRPLRVGL
jgi:hypothetical protein